MLFVSLMKSKPGSTIADRTKRRLDWTYPQGMRVLAEYWLAGANPEVVLVSESDDASTIYTAVRQWADMFEITVTPAITADVGLAQARELYALALA